MAIKLVDELKAMGNFPIAHAEGINLVKTDGTEDNLQTLYNNGELSGGDTSQTLTEAEYLALPEEERLNNSYYLYDVGVHYKNGVAYSRKKPIQLTMEEYKALGEVDPDQEYIVSADEQGILLEASDIGYSNAVSNLPCTTVQGAIDKVNANLGDKADKSYVDDNFATMDKVNALHTKTVGYITGSLLGSVVKNANLYYQKFGDSRLVINGWVSIDAVSAKTPIFTLPNNWKANSNYLLPCYVDNSNVACACLINIAEGTVNSYTPLPATTELRFCGEIYVT